MNYKEQIHDGNVYHIFSSSDDVWNAFQTTHKKEDGWLIGNYNGYENCCWRSQ